MVKIITQQAVCDGHDVLCQLSDGRRMTFHFQVAPKNVQAAVDALEAQYPAIIEAPAPIILATDGKPLPVSESTSVVSIVESAYKAGYIKTNTLTALQDYIRPLSVKPSAVVSDPLAEAVEK